MKKMLVVTLILFATININAQTFSKKIYNDNGGSNFIETYDNNYAFHYKDSLTIFDNHGNILSQEKNYDNNCQPIDFFYLPNNKYLSIGICDKLVGESYTLWFREYDENFNITKEEYEILDYTDSRMIYTYDCIVNNNYEPIIIIDKIQQDFGGLDTTFLYHFSAEDYKLIFDTAYTDYLWMRQCVITQIPDNSGYLLCSGDMNGLYHLELSNNFDIKDTLISPINLPSYGLYWDFAFIDSNSYIMSAGLRNQVVGNDQIGVVKFNTNGEVLKETSSASNTDNRLPRRKCLSFVDSSYIYTAYSVSTIEYNSPAPTLIGVTKLDIDLNIIWEKFYGDSINKYVSYNINATKDGGAVIIGVVRDNFDSPFFNIIIKIDSLGNNEEEFTGIDNSETNSIIKSHELIIYPNPGNENMQVRTAVQQLGGVFYIYDITGKLVLQHEVTSSITQINTSSLLSGTYIYKYINNNELIENGKWVKE